jgi:predicted transglutaminase-like cysteine proteinase
MRAPTLRGRADEAASPRTMPVALRACRTAMRPLLRRAASALALTAWLLALPGAVLAGETGWGHVGALATGATVPGPAGWLNRCMADLASCRSGTDETTVPADGRTLELLDQVQRAVNHAIAPQREPPGRDLWEMAPARGDCEDYALTKQARLRSAGLPRNAIRLATVELPNGESHAILTVRTTRGTLVLDNLQAEVVPFGALPYRWLAIEEPGEGLRWRELRGGPAEAVPQLVSAAGTRQGAPTGGVATSMAGQ